MFYLFYQNKLKINIKKINSKSNHKTIFYTNNTLYSFLYPLHKHLNSIFIFKKNKYDNININLPLVTRFSKISSISLKKSQIVLEKIICDLIKNFSFNTLYYFFKKLF